MDRHATRQGGPRRLRRGIGQGVLVAKGHDPLIVHHQEIENRPLKVNIPCASAQVVHTRPGCIQKCRQQFVIGHQPCQSLKGQDLSGVLLHFFGFLHVLRPVLAAI